MENENTEKIVNGSPDTNSGLPVVEKIWPEGWKNKLYFGDNLTLMRDKRNFESGSVNLIYLDPPFNSGRNYNLIFQEENGLDSDAQIHAFKDTWKWTEQTVKDWDNLKAWLTDQVESHQSIKSEKLLGLLEGLIDKYLKKSSVAAYLVEMTPRLIEMHRILNDKGSIYLHCDPTASHYLKLLMDAIFGVENFRNEIIWCYATPSAVQKSFPNKHDVILFYTKTDDYFFESPRIPHKSGLHNKGKVWKADYDNPEKVKDLESLGKKVEDWWIDIYPVDRVRTERIGYDSQKPEALLERIITASCPADGIVFDPFCGCGTTVAVAQKMGVRWIGIDITHLAIQTIRKRFDGAGVNKETYEIRGVPVDLNSAKALAEEDPYEFEYWAISLTISLKGEEVRPLKDKKKGGDEGIDGKLFFKEDGEKKTMILSVKSGKPLASYVDQLHGSVDRHRAQMGGLILLNKPTEGMLKRAAECGTYPFKLAAGKTKDFQKIQIITIEELLNGKKLDYPYWTKEDISQPKFKPRGRQITLTESKPKPIDSD